MVSLVLVENEFVLAEDVPSRLRAAGFDIIGTAATGKDALAQARELHPDVVLMDPVLKGKMDGIEAAQQITERFDIPVIFLTAGADAATVRRATETASYGFLVMPFDDLELRAAIEMAIYKHRMEVTARESDRRMRELTESLSEVLFETDLAGNITFINRAGLKEFGYTKEQVEGGITLYDFLPPDKHAEIRESVAQAVIDEPSEWIEVPALRRDGSTFPASVRASVIVREGVPAGIRGIAVNVTEQKRAEQRLEASEQRFRALFESSPIVQIRYDVDGYPCYVNRAGLEFFGIADVADIQHVSIFSSSRVTGANKAKLRAGHTVRYEQRYDFDEIKKHGDFPTTRSGIRFVDFHLAPLFEVGTGKVEGYLGQVADITERKRAEQELQESERRIRELTDALPEIMFETDANGIITFANATAFTQYGYTIEAIEGKMNLFELVAPFDRERARETNSKRILGEDQGWVEYALIKNDGSTSPFDVRTTPIVRDGVFEGLRGIAIDITERKRAEAALIRSERRIRELTDALPEIMFETDANGITTFVNATAFGLGYTKEEVEGKMNLLDVVAPFDLERAREAFGKRIQGEDAGWAEYTFIRKDGSTSPFDVRTTPIVRDGVFEGLRGIAIDITERKRAEAALIRSERRIRELTDALPVVVYETDATGRITFVNATALDLFGYTKEELEAGMSLFQLIVPADTKRARAVFRRRMSGEDVGRVEYTGLRKDESTFNMAARSALMKQDGAVVGQRGVILDITEQKRAEERVQEHTHTIETLNRIVTEGNRATDVQSFVEAATKLACELMHFDIGGIYLIDADARYATLQYGQGLPETARDAIEKIPYHDAPFSAILIDGDPLFAEDYVTFLPQHAPLGVASLASVPLYSRDTIIGALNVGSAIRHTFSQTEKALLVAIGNEVGTVIAKLQADASVRAALKEKETLLKEIHHRVKNNMQVVSSLMSLQADRATNGEAQAVLTASQSQIRSMALIHEKLYSSGTLSEIEFADYVGSLIKELLQMYHVAPDAVTITTDIEDVRFGVDIAMPCALILNELVSNCLKYAFPDGRVGEVIVGMHYADGTYTLTVADNGVGFPADVDFRATGSLGMQLVTALVDQLDGTIDMNRENGTSFVISFSPAP